MLADLCCIPRPPLNDLMQAGAVFGKWGRNGGGRGGALDGVERYRAVAHLRGVGSPAVCPAPPASNPALPPSSTLPPAGDLLGVAATRACSCRQCRHVAPRSGRPTVFVYALLTYSSPCPHCTSAASFPAASLHLLHRPLHPVSLTVCTHRAPNQRFRRSSGCAAAHLFKSPQANFGVAVVHACSCRRCWHVAPRCGRPWYALLSYSPSTGRPRWRPGPAGVLPAASNLPATPCFCNRMYATCTESVFQGN